MCRARVPAGRSVSRNERQAAAARGARAWNAPWECRRTRRAPGGLPALVGRRQAGWRRSRPSSVRPGAPARGPRRASTPRAIRRLRQERIASRAGASRRNLGGQPDRGDSASPGPGGSWPTSGSSRRARAPSRPALPPRPRPRSGPDVLPHGSPAGTLRSLPHRQPVEMASLLPGGEGLRWLAVPARSHLKWAEGPGLIQVHEGVVAAGEHRRHVVAVTLAGRIVDDADGAMGPAIEKPFLLRAGEDQQPVPLARRVQDGLPAPLAGGRDRHARHGSAPPRAGYYAAPVRAETNEHDVFVSPFFARELADVDHSAPRHVGVASIAYVGVMLPDDPPGLRAVVVHQPL